MAQKVKFLNGLAIVSIVFILISGIPLGIISGIAVTSGSSYSSFDITVGAGTNETFMIDAESNARTFLVYWISNSEPQDFDVYIMTYYEYEYWQSSNDSLPTDFSIRTNGEDMYRAIPGNGDHFILIVNNGTTDLYYASYHVSTQLGFAISGGILAVIFAFFMIIIVLNTIGYFIKYLIIWPITGAGKYQSNGSKSKTRYANERKDDRYDYQYVSASTPASSGTKTTPKATSVSVTGTKTVTPTPISAPRRKVAAAHAIGNYIVAGQTKRYDNKSDFLNKVTRYWDHTNIPERVLSLIAIFFLVLGIVTTSWFLIAVMPITFLGIAFIVFFTNRNTTEKLIRVVESYQAIYVYDAAKVLNTSSDILRMNIWKIIRLGLAPIGYDSENAVLFDVTKVDPSKKEKLSPAAETIHQQLVAEVDKKEEKKEETVVAGNEIKCPFCDSDNPSDSLFCIKCGASLKPAK